MGGTDSQFQKPISGSIPAAAQTIDLTSPNSATEIVEITGTWIGTLVIEGSNDGSTYYTIDSTNRSTRLIVTSITANGSFQANTNGFQFLQIRSSAWTSGSATITVYGSDATSLISTDTLLRGASDGTAIGNVADALKITGTVTAAEDKNFGTVGANTQRTAAQVGNATGPADFNAGATGAQTIRTVANQGAPNTNANAWFERLTDGTNNAGVSANGDLKATDVWNVSSASGNIAVTTSAVRIKVGASELTNRKVFYIQPQDGAVWIGASSSVSSTIGNANAGIKIAKMQIFPMIFTANVQTWMVTNSGTTNVAVFEGS